VAPSRAGTITTAPIFRNSQAPISWPSRRNAISHRMVAREPVTDRFGPRSTPIRIASFSCGAMLDALAAKSADGRLLIALDSPAIPKAAPRLPAQVGRVLRYSMPDARAPAAPARFIPATKTNRPATSGITLHEICIASFGADARAAISTVTIAAMHVGRPRSSPKADASANIKAVATIPHAARTPNADSSGRTLASATAPRRLVLETHAKTTKVTKIETTDGNAKACSHGRSGGSDLPYTTRFAGFDIGSTKLAALAMNAQANR
jgi:hypothetical protein